MINDIEKLSSVLDTNLSQEERASMRADFGAFLDAHPIRRRIPSPYLRQFQHGLTYAFLLFIVVAVPTTLAAERSLPNEALYPLKTELIEQAALQLASFSGEAEARVHVALVDRRLSEAETLIARDQDTSETLAGLASEVTESTEAVQELVDVSDREDDGVRDAGNELEARLGVHRHILEVIVGEKSSESIDGLAEGIDTLREETADSIEKAEDRTALPEEVQQSYEEVTALAAARINELTESLEGKEALPESFEDEAYELLAQAQQQYEEAAALKETDIEAAIERMDDARSNARQGILLLTADERLSDEN